MLAGMMEAEAAAEEKKPGKCPLRRVQLWHVIPLCLLAIVNLFLVIIALLGLAIYRVTIGIRAFAVNLTKADLDCNPYAESLGDMDSGATIVEEKT